MFFNDYSLVLLYSHFTILKYTETKTNLVSQKYLMFKVIRHIKLLLKYFYFEL